MRSRTTALAVLGLAALLAGTPRALAGYVDIGRMGADHSIDYQLGREAATAQDWARAAEHLEAAVRSTPQDADAQHWLGVAYAKLGRDADAVARWREAIAQDGAHRAARAALGEALARAGDRKGAQAQLDALRRACGDCGEARSLADALAAKRAR